MFMIFKRLLKTIALPVLLRLFSHSLFAQKVISGRVTDSKDGTGIPGVSVTLKGANSGVQTGSDGSYRLSVPDNAKTIVVTSVGFATQEVPIGDSTAVDVALVSSNTSLGEVVVVGYGTSRKRDLSTAVVQVTPKDFNKGVNQ